MQMLLVIRREKPLKNTRSVKPGVSLRLFLCHPEGVGEVVER